MKLAISLAPGLFGIILVLSSGTAHSQPAVQRISSTQAQGLSGPIRTLTVWPGAGTNLSVIPTGETIRKVILDDPSQIGLDFDGPMCAVHGNSDSAKSNCQESAASVIHLRQNTPLQFKQLPKAKSRTLLSVVTEEATGKKKLYSFWVTLGTGEPQYQPVAIYPDTPPTQAVVRHEPEIELAQLERGVRLAQAQGWVYPQQPLWSKLQQFLGAVQMQVPVPVAAQRSGISMALVRKLSELGRGGQVYSPSPNSSGDDSRQLLLPQSPMRF